MGTNITGIGNANAIGFKSRVTGGIYFPPELKDALVGVWSAYGKSNDSTDRNIIKNKIKDRGGDFVISNAAFKLNSGFGKYEVDFTTWSKVAGTSIITDSKYVLTDEKAITNGGYFLWNRLAKDSFKVKISNIPNGGWMSYRYRITEEDTQLSSLFIREDGIYTLPATVAGSDVDFFISTASAPAKDWVGLTITQIPSFEGAFVTDGVNDLITSAKTVQEMGITDEITVVSMIHKISSDNNWSNLIGELKGNHTFVANRGINTDKTGIYGYTYNYNENAIVINNILGDKNDYIVKTSTSLGLDNKYYVTGFRSAGIIQNISQVAWYWTFIANRVLTTDEINQVIAYYNLDRTLKPDMLCNITKQGITNDNHADFNDKLIDYSGNGRDIQMYNLAWKGGSGIAAKKFETIKDYSIIPDEGLQELTIYNEFSFKIKSIRYADRYWAVQSLNKTDMSYPLTIITDKDIIWRNTLNYTDADGVKGNVKKETNVPANTPTQVFIYGFNDFVISDDYTKVNCVAYATRKNITEFTVTFIPSCKGGLLLDGVNDFGQFVGDLGLKDYTLIMNRAYNNLINNQVPLISSNIAEDQTPFIVEHWNTGSNAISFSYGASSTTDIPLDINKKIVYQSTYSYMGYVIPKGNAISTGNGITLGKFGNGVQYSAICLWSLMLFPYSMSEFLIERQLKKHKLGTLYPDMVEFRPVIKANNDYEIVYTAIIKPDNWQEISIGDYVTVGKSVAIQIKLNNPLEVTNVSSNSLADVSFHKEETGDNVYTIYGRLLDGKSPQKISLTIEQDENYVKFEPVITSNVEYVRLDFYLNNYQKRINIGDYIPKDAYLRANLYLKNNVDELTVFTFNGVNIGYRRSSVDDTAFNINQIYNYDSPQEVNITIDEYIRYEDIDFTNCYPGVPSIYVNDKSVTWGDKLKVGDEFTFYGNVNILPEMYNVLVKALYNGEEMVYSSIGTISKSMVFTSFKTYIFDDNEPKCILSPRLLRIPNSSYKILGHIPDISGHGNHGVIHNSAYTQMSGANGYGTNLGNWSINSANTGKIITQREEHLEYEVLSADKNILFYNTKIENDTFVIYTSVNTNIVYSKESDIIANIPANTPTKVVCPKIGTILLKTNETPTVGNIITVKQYGIYEGAYCFDGVDDFVTIPTTVGGKQVLMKVNWDSPNASILYDQRGYNNEFAIYNSTNDNDGNPIPAYQGRNNGQTYIDGILNSNIKASELRAITHNITITNELSSGANKIYPIIGSSKSNAYFAQMSLYDFMLFDEISTDDKIKELNEYVGVEAKVELPPYYWDTYGKTNSDADRDTIQQRGVAVGDYDLTNYNHAYEGMSGYNGYPIILSGTNRTYQNKASYVNVVGDDKNVINLTRISFNTAAIFSYVKQNGELTSYNKYIESFKIKVTGIDYSRFVIKYSYISEANATAKTTIAIASDGIYELPKSFASDGSLTSSDIWIGINFTKQSNDMPDIIEDVNLTIEVLPEYENGLAYDGVEDYSENVNIPIVDDFTFLVKASLLKGFTGSGGLIARKGDVKHVTSGGYAFVYCLDSSSNEANRNSYYSFGKALLPSTGAIDPPLIGYMTKTSVNGVATTFGTNPDIKGINFGDWNGGRMSMVVYKSMLYPKTIPLLQINFLKNLMEKDEIIDLNNPIFIKNE
jgi:hypothetical protein